MKRIVLLNPSKSVQFESITTEDINGSAKELANKYKGKGEFLIVIMNNEVAVKSVKVLF
jgi:hypothetical protein